jgi:hypothetical protein
MDSNTYISVYQKLTAYKKCVGEVGCGSCFEEDQDRCDDDNDYEAKSKPVPSFTRVLHAFESMRVFCILTLPKETKQTS